MVLLKLFCLRTLELQQAKRRPRKGRTSVRLSGSENTQDRF